MNDKIRFQETFSHLHASADTITEVLKMTTLNTSKSDQKESTRGIFRAMRTVLIAAVLVVALTVSAYAAGRLLNSPQQAWEVAQQEVAAWKDLDLLAPTVTLPDQPDRIEELKETTGDGYWFHRLFSSRYNIYCESNGNVVSLDVDTGSGKITRIIVDSRTSFDSVFPMDMTVDRFCTGLAEYWGFSGYTLSGTKDSFYGYDTASPVGEQLLTDFSDAAYLTIFFDGDQSGVPMYVELSKLPDGVCFTAGTKHLLG